MKTYINTQRGSLTIGLILPNDRSVFVAFVGGRAYVEDKEIQKAIESHPYFNKTIKLVEGKKEEAPRKADSEYVKLEKQRTNQLNIEALKSAVLESKGIDVEVPAKAAMVEIEAIANTHGYTFNG